MMICNYYIVLSHRRILARTAACYNNAEPGALVNDLTGCSYMLAEKCGIINRTFQLLIFILTLCGIRRSIRGQLRR